MIGLNSKASDGLFLVDTLGITTNRDAWVYNFSEKALIANVTKTIDFFNDEVKAFARAKKNNSSSIIDEIISVDLAQISWSRGLKNRLQRLTEYSFQDGQIAQSSYRPFCKQWIYVSRVFNEYIYQMPKIFPEGLSNLAIVVSGVGASKEFSAIITNVIPNLHLHDTGQCFPLYTYENNEDSRQSSLLDGANDFRKKSNIPDAMLKTFRIAYGDDGISKDDIFYYVYGILHSPEYRTRFSSDLKKMLPRIPLAQDFWTFSKAGSELAKWHLNYETIETYKLDEHSSKLTLNPKSDYQVSKMTFAKKDGAVDKTTIIYNSLITLSGIPPEAYDYVVNGKPAIDWIMERYQFTKDKDSGIINDPNQWSEDPRYILDLLKRIVRVSLETMKIVNALPPLKERKE